MINIEFNNLKPVMYILYILLLICTSCSFKEPKPPQVTFDVPALIGKNIDEIRKVLGKPLYDEIEPSNPKEETFENDFKKNGETLIVYFSPNSRRISELTLISSEEYDRLEDVMKIGNLTSKETDSYWVESFHPFAGTPPFDGIKIHVR